MAGTASRSSSTAPLTVPLNARQTAESPEQKPAPRFWADKYALRHAINANPILGLFPGIRRTAQPTYGERIWLFALYMMTGLFLEHLSLLYGPICRRAYKDQCGLDDWSLNATMTDDHGRQVPKPLLEIKQSANELLADTAITDNKLMQTMDRGAKDVHENLEGSRMQIVRVLSGHIRLDCNMTMCDHWIEAMAKPDETRLTRAYKSWLLYPGLCRCSHTRLQQITYRISVAVASVVFQTILFKSFHVILSRDWEHSDGCKRRLNDCAMSLIDFVLFFELLSIFLIRFVPEAWVISLIASSISVMTLSLLTSFTVAHLGLARRFAELEDDDEKQAGTKYDDPNSLELE